MESDVVVSLLHSWMKKVGLIKNQRHAEICRVCPSTKKKYNVWKQFVVRLPPCFSRFSHSISISELNSFYVPRALPQWQLELSVRLARAALASCLRSGSPQYPSISDVRTGVMRRTLPSHLKAWPILTLYCQTWNKYRRVVDAIQIIHFGEVNNPNNLYPKQIFTQWRVGTGLIWLYSFEKFTL